MSMDDETVRYENAGYTSMRRRGDRGGLAAFLVRNGFAKDEQKANKILFAILVIAIAIGIGAWIV